MQYAMTDDFASTMVTVIPIILIVGTTEVHTLVRTQPTDESAPVERELPRLYVLARSLARLLLGASWTTVVLLHADYEVQLIEWLADPKHTTDPDLAKNVVTCSMVGFYFVAVLTVLLYMRKAQPFSQFGDQVARARSAPVEPEVASAPSRPRMRPLYPAHRAVRRPRRSPRRAGTTRAR